MPSIEERFSTALHHSARAWRQALDARLKHLGIGQAGWMAIASIAKSADPLSQRELADLLGIEGPSMVAAIDRLVAAGLVLRSPSPTDRRVKLIVLTDAGRAMYDKVRTEADAFRAACLSGVDQAALRSATEVLEALRSRIEAAE
jgi:MarR family transcriptional regulator, transcriptional regulator for hemolysin